MNKKDLIYERQSLYNVMTQLNTLKYIDVKDLKFKINEEIKNITNKIKDAE